MTRQRTEWASSGLNESGGLMDLFRYNKISMGVAAIGAAIGMYYMAATTNIRPDEFGVRQVMYSPIGMLGERGTHDEKLTTGLHREIPFFEKIYKFPRDVKVLTLRNPPTATDRDAEVISKTDERFTSLGNSAHIQTSDGFYVNLDVSILYRIVDPVKVMKTIGAGELYEVNGILPKAEPALKAVLGGMQPEDFFNADLRHNKMNEARDVLNQQLEQYGLKVDHVLARYPHLHPDVASRIEGQNLEAQKKLLNMSLTTQSEAQSILTKVKEEGIAAQKVKLQIGTAYTTTKNSEKDLYERTKKAEGDKIRKLAEATKTEMINKAYEGSGSEMLVGLKMAENLSGLEVILVPAGRDFNPLSIESMMRTISPTNGGGLR